MARQALPGQCAHLLGGGARCRPSGRALALALALTIVAAAAYAVATGPGGAEPPPPHDVPVLLPAAHAGHYMNTYGERCNTGLSVLAGAYPRPTVSSIRFISPDGAYFVGESVLIRVNGTNDINSQQGTVVDHTRLLLNTAPGVDRFAVHSSHNFTGGYVDYNYTVAAGDGTGDLDYKDSNSLYWRHYRFASSHVQSDNPPGTDYICTLPDPGAAGSLSAQGDVGVIGIARPDAYVRPVSPAGAYGTGSVVTLAAEFAERAVYDVADPPSLLLNVSGMVRTAEFWTGNDTKTFLFNYTVRHGDVDADLGYNGTGALAGTIRDRDGDSINKTLPSVDTLALLGDIALYIPANVSSVSSPNMSGTYKVGQTITVSVNFTKPVTVDTASGTPVLALETGETDRNATYASGSGSARLLFEYDIEHGDEATDLDYKDASSLSLNGGSIVDADGYPADLALGDPAGGLIDDGALIVDTVPQVESVSTGEQSRAYGLGKTFLIGVKFDAAVNVTGPATLALVAGPTSRSAAYESGNGSDTLVFNYTVGAGDRVDDLRYAGTGALSGNITNAVVGGPANTTLPDPSSAAGMLSESGPILVDHAAPVLFPWAKTADGVFSTAHRVQVAAAFVDNGTQYLLAGHTGLDVFRVHENGTLERTGSAPASDRGFLLDEVVGLEAFAVGGRTYAIATTSTLDSIQLIRVHGHNGTLVQVYNLTKADDSLTIGGPRGLDVFRTGGGGGTVHALVAGSEDDAVHLVRVNGDETMSPVALVSTTHPAGAGIANLQSPIRLDAFTLGNGSVRALVTAYDANAVHLLSAGGAGLAGVSFAEDGTDSFVLGGPVHVAAFKLGDEWHALVGSNQSDSVQLIRVPGSGGMEAVRSVRYDSPGFGTQGNPAHMSVLGGARGGGDSAHAILTFQGISGGVQLVRMSGGPAVAGSLLAAGHAVNRGPVVDGNPAPAGGGESTGGTFALAVPNDIATFEMGGYEYAAVAAAGSHVLQVIQMSRASVDSVNSSTPDGTLVEGSLVRVSVNFNDNVTYSGGAPVLRLNVSGLPAEAAYERGSGTPTLVFNYTVVQGDNTADLAYYGVAALEGDLRDPNGYRANPTLPVPGSDASLSGSAGIVLDTEGPRALSVSSPNSTGSPHGINRTIHVIVEFDEDIVVDASQGAPTLALALGTGGSAEYVPPAQRGSSMLFEYTVVEGDWSERLDYAGASSLSLNGAVVRDDHGNARSAVLLPPQGENSLAGTSSVAVDGLRPVAVSVSSPSPPGTYVIGETVRIRVAFNETVVASGQITLGLDVGGADRRAAHVPSAEATDTLLFAYTVVEGDMSADLDYAGRSALRLGGGASIADRAGNPANLALPPTGSDRSLAGTSAIAVNGTPGAAPVGDRDGGGMDGGDGDRDGMDGGGMDGMDGGGMDGMDGGDTGGGNGTAAGTCSATLESSDIPFGSVAAGSRSDVKAQRISSNGTLPLDEVAVRATDWTRTGAGGAGLAMHANATQARAGSAGEWMPLAGGGVRAAIGDDGLSAYVEFSVVLPADALRQGSARVDAAQTVTYTISCVEVPG